jgi:hypothetical protein
MARYFCLFVLQHGEACTGRMALQAGWAEKQATAAALVGVIIRRRARSSGQCTPSMLEMSIYMLILCTWA